MTRRTSSTTRRIFYMVQNIAQDLIFRYLQDFPSRLQIKKPGNPQTLQYDQKNILYGIQYYLGFREHITLPDFPLQCRKLLQDRTIRRLGLAQHQKNVLGVCNTCICPSSGEMPGIYCLISLFRIAASSTPLFWSCGMNFVIIRQPPFGLHIRLSRVG